MFSTTIQCGPLWTSARVCGPFALVLACLMATGCGGGGEEVPSGTLSGTVTLDGQPFTEGQVSIYAPELGIGASAPLDDEGRFVIEEPIPTGTYGVAVMPPPEPAPHEAPANAPPMVSNIPAKYRDHNTSGITVQIKEGENELTIPMMP